MIATARTNRLNTNGLFGGGKMNYIGGVRILLGVDTPAQSTKNFSTWGDYTLHVGGVAGS